MVKRKPVRDTEDQSERPLAFLVDGDNASPKLVGHMLAEASKFGSVKIRRVYGDWSSKGMENWRKELQEHAITPIQQFPNVKGKNATDSALIIEAMDLLHKGPVEGFCIVSSDSDYTRLAMRIRDEGHFVMVIGERKTPDALRKASDVFVLTDNLKPVSLPADLPQNKAEEARDTLLEAFESVADEDGLVSMAKLGLQLRKLDPGFDPRTYGARKLVNLVEDLPDDFVIERHDERGPGAVFVRRRQMP